jgi:hypothetical protein
MSHEPATPAPKRWWDRPKTIIIFVCAIVAGTAALIKDSKTIGKFFGFSTDPKVTLKVTGQQFSDRNRTWSIEVILDKTGEGPLHDCKFSSWVEGKQLLVLDPSKPFDIPSGKFIQHMFPIIGLIPRLMVTGDYGEISLTCDKAGSENARWPWGDDNDDKVDDKK